MKRMHVLLMFSLLTGSLAFAQTSTDTAEPPQDTQAASVDIRKCVGGHCDRNVTSEPNMNYSPKRDAAQVASLLSTDTGAGSNPAGSSK